MKVTTREQMVEVLRGIFGELSKDIYMHNVGYDCVYVDGDISIPWLAEKILAALAGETTGKERDDQTS